MNIKKSKTKEGDQTKLDRDFCEQSQPEAFEAVIELDLSEDGLRLW